MRFFLTLVAATILGTLGASAQNTSEAIVLTGGPALRFMEHGKGEVSHDVYWFNFVDASVLRLDELKAKATPGELLTWMIYKPAYVARSKEMGLDLIAQLNDKARKIGAHIQWFDTKEDLLAYLNRGQDRNKVKVTNFDYFGHSNKACFLFDYSNTIDTMSIAWLHEKDLRYIENNVFAKDATCKSWGCHSGEEYSKWWKSQFDVPMTGAIGKTDFAHGGLPELSNDQGKWTQ